MTVKVLICQQYKNNKSGKWFIKFIEATPTQYVFDLMNWIGSKDAHKTIHLTFDTKEEAISFAKKKNFQYEVQENKTRILRAISYADNFN